MKRFLTRSLALALCLALSCSAVPGARAASDDPPSLASASAEDIYATPPNTNRDGLLRFSDEATVSFGTSGSSSKMTVADALNQACRSLSRSVRGTACSLDYISYVAISPNQGTLYNGYIAEGDPGAGVAGVLNYYYNNPEMSYKIEDLQFVPKISFSGNAVVTYYGYYNYYDSVMDANRVGSYAGRLYITVGKQEPGIAYSTDGEAVRFSADEFTTYSLAVTGRNFRYVTFTLPSSSYGKLYYNYLSDSIYDAEVESGKRYYRSTNPLLGNVYFVPKEGFVPKSGNAETIPLSFSGVDLAGTSFTGQVNMTITTYGPNNTYASSGSFTYNVKSGQSVTLKTSDFSEKCQRETGSSLRYIRFSALPSHGTLYDNSYSGNSSEYHVSVNRTYYTPSNIRYTAESGYSGTVTVPFVCYATNGEWFDGQVSFVVSDNGSEPLRYIVEPGKRVYFVMEDFENACLDSTGYSLNRIRLTAIPSSYDGTLYSSGNVITSSGNTYYKSTLNNLSFVASGDFSGSISISFTGYANYGSRTFSGGVTISAKDDSSSSKNSETPIGSSVSPIAHSVKTSAVLLNISAILGAASSRLSGAPATVSVSRPEHGSLYLEFTSLSSRKPFYSSRSYPVSELSQIFYLPEAGFHGTDTAIYTVIDSSGNSASGNLTFSVSPPIASSYFNDMSNQSWAVPAADFFRLYSVVYGVSEGSFGPTLEMRRGDYILMLSRAFSLPYAGTASFADVPEGKYYAAAIASAKSLGILTGNATDSFAPAEAITRQEAMVYLYRAMSRNGQIEPGSAENLAGFPDRAEVADEAIPAMGALARLGILQGDSGYLRPSRTLTRAETVKLLYYALA